MRVLPALGVALSIVLSGAQPADERRTTVVPLPEEDILSPCEYRLVIPNSKQPVKATWVIFDRGRDYLNWYQDGEIGKFAGEFQLALVLAAHCRSKERDDMIVEPSKGVGRALFTALDQFAQSAHRPELKTMPIIVLGWSGAGSLMGRLAGYRTDRYLAGIGYAPGQYEALGMDTIQLSEDAIRAPQLIIANGGDNVNGTERPYGYFKKYFDRGAPWTFVVQNRTPHCCLQNAKTLILEWLRGVLSAKKGTLGGGQFGYIVPEFSDVRDDWKRPVFNVKSARVSQTRAAGATEFAAGWLPTKKFATEWLTFVQRPQPVAVWKP